VDVRADLGDRVGRPVVALAQLEEPAAVGQGAQALLDQLATQRVEHDVRAVAVGRGEHLVGEAHRAGVEHVRHAQAAEEVALGIGAGRGQHLGAAPLRDLHGGQPDTAGRGVDEHPPARADAGDALEAEHRRQEGDRQRGGILDR
jgi:hypothetical protein